MIAAAQSAPVYLDAAASTEKACGLIAQAGSQGVDLVAFGETWLPGYPFFAWHSYSPERFDAAALYLDQAIAVPGPETDALATAAAEADIDVVIGVAELDQQTEGTVYCTALMIGREGEILGGHRKLKPTLNERTVWGEGSGDDLNVYQRSFGRVSALNCWEHQMVLPGYTLMAQGTQVHAALWPGGDPAEAPRSPWPLYSRQELLTRAFAAQGACYVIGAGGLMTPEDVPDRFRSLAGESTGDSVIVDPRGEVVARAERGEETLLIHKADLSVVRTAKSVCDVAGHYARPDVFGVTVLGQETSTLRPLPQPDIEQRHWKNRSLPHFPDQHDV